jgi:hypothetical protein
MASLFPTSAVQTCTLLDAGAGVGALTCSFLDRWATGDGLRFEKTEVEAYEIDATLRAYLETTLASYGERLPLESERLPPCGGEEFIPTALKSLNASMKANSMTLRPMLVVGASR